MKLWSRLPVAEKLISRLQLSGLQLLHGPLAPSRSLHWPLAQGQCILRVLRSARESVRSSTQLIGAARRDRNASASSAQDAGTIANHRPSSQTVESIQESRGGGSMGSRGGSERAIPGKATAVNQRVCRMCGGAIRHSHCCGGSMVRPAGGKWPGARLWHAVPMHGRSLSWLARSLA
jgi:hypothetical protein